MLHEGRIRRWACPRRSKVGGSGRAGVHQGRGRDGRGRSWTALRREVEIAVGVFMLAGWPSVTCRSGWARSISRRPRLQRRRRLPDGRWLQDGVGGRDRRSGRAGSSRSASRTSRRGWRCTSTRASRSRRRHRVDQDQGGSSARSSSRSTRVAREAGRRRRPPHRGRGPGRHRGVDLEVRIRQNLGPCRTLTSGRRASPWYSCCRPRVGPDAGRERAGHHPDPRGEPAGRAQLRPRGPAGRRRGGADPRQAAPGQGDRLPAARAHRDPRPVPARLGGPGFSPDEKYDLDITGVFIRAGFEIIQPIFTGG